jgi:streptogrisin C
MLQKWNGKRWAAVAAGSKSGSTESVSYTGAAGKYRWQVERVKGRGSYALKITHPA